MHARRPTDADEPETGVSLVNVFKCVGLGGVVGLGVGVGVQAEDGAHVRFFGGGRPPGPI